MALTQASSRKRTNSSVLELVALTGLATATTTNARTSNSTIDGRIRFFIEPSSFLRTSSRHGNWLSVLNQQETHVFLRPHGHSASELTKCAIGFQTTMTFCPGGLWKDLDDASL